MISFLYFDGNFHHTDNGKGKMTGGWVVMLQTNPIVVAAGTSNPRTRKEATSTDSEWRALVAGLAWVAHLRGVKELRIRGDCTGVVNAVKEKKRPKTGIAIDYFSEVFGYLKRMQMPAWSIRHLGREHNHLADSVARGNEISGIPQGEGLENPFRRFVVSTVARHLHFEAGQPSHRDLDFWLEAEDIYNLSQM